MKRLLCLMFALFALLPVADRCFAQDFGRAGSQLQLSSLSDSDKVHFINRNFYKLYSADFENSNELAAWAVNTASANGWTRQEATALMNWGVITFLSGDYEKALPRYFAALTLFEKQNDKEGIAAVNNEMAVFYSKQGDLINSFKCLDRAEKLCRETGDLEKLGTNLGNRGAILAKHKRYAEAEPYFLEVYKIRKKTNDSTGLGYVLLDLADIARRKGDIKKALIDIDRSTTIRHNIGDTQGVAINLITKGELFLASHQYQEALPWLEAGIEKSTSLGYTDLAREGHDALANAYIGLGDYRNAYIQREKWHALSDSLFNIAKTKVINELQTKYNTEKKEMQLAEQQLTLERNRWLILLLLFALGLLTALVFILRRQTEIKKKQEKLRIEKEYQNQLIESTIASQEKERARFAKDLHDGFGQLISSAKLFLSKSKEPDTSAARDLLDQMHLEIRNIAFALLPGTLVNEGLLSAIRELASRINASGTITLDVDGTNMEDRLPEQMEVSLYRVSQEWINNILKYGNATLIHLQLVKHDDYLSMVIEDDGAGFDPALLANGTGNGWKNIQSRIRLHRGTVTVESAAGMRGSILMADVPLDTMVPHSAMISEKNNRP